MVSILDQYVEGFLLAVEEAKKGAYIEHAAFWGGVFKEYGMVSMVECWGDDIPEGKLTSFPLAVKRQEGETVVFSWMIWPSKAFRDEAWAKIEQDPRMINQEQPMPFDGKRMIFGGFQPIVAMD